jgi:arylsulfatase A-like enzyme
MAEGAVRGRRRRGGPGRTVSAAFLALLLGLPSCAPERPRNAVLIVLDTLRADRLSAYGNPRATSPALDALAQRGVLFERVVSNAPWTLPAMTALLTSEYPSGRSYRDGLQRSLVEKLREAGFATVAFTEGGFVSRRFGFEQGFELFREHDAAVRVKDPGAAIKGIETTFAWAKEWLDRHGRERPFFLMLHTYETHVPYRRRTWVRDLEPGRLGSTYEVDFALFVSGNQTTFDDAELAYLRALYDGGVSEADRQVGELLAKLAELGLARETLVAVTSDHGEDLGDRIPMRPGNHGHTLYDEQLLVPLILHDPTLRHSGKRIAAQVRLVDVLVTFCDRLGLPPEKDRHGRSLVPLMTGAESEDRLAFLEVPPTALLRHEPRSGIRSGRFKLIESPGAGGRPQLEVYDLAADPAEHSNLAAADPERARALARELEELRARLAALGPARYRPRHGAQDPAQEERLRSLGYLE